MQRANNHSLPTQLLNIRADAESQQPQPPNPTVEHYSWCREPTTTTSQPNCWTLELMQRANKHNLPTQLLNSVEVRTNLYPRQQCTPEPGQLSLLRGLKTLSSEWLNIIVSFYQFWKFNLVEHVSVYLVQCWTFAVWTCSKNVDYLEFQELCLEQETGFHESWMLILLNCIYFSVTCQSCITVTFVFLYKEGRRYDIWYTSISLYCCTSGHVTLHVLVKLLFLIMASVLIS